MIIVTFYKKEREIDKSLKNKNISGIFFISISSLTYQQAIHIDFCL